MFSLWHFVCIRTPEGLAELPARPRGICGGMEHTQRASKGHRAQDTPTDVTHGSRMSEDRKGSRAALSGQVGVRQRMSGVNQGGHPGGSFWSQREAAWQSESFFPRRLPGCESKQRAVWSGPPCVTGGRAAGPPQASGQTPHLEPRMMSPHLSHSRRGKYNMGNICSSSRE